VGEYRQRLPTRRRVRVTAAAPKWSLASSAAECGFADQSYFTQVFR